ncbi:hypothetical protein NW762_001169 [Fusarium torreyae]|uniref:Uncharacterized protein n=1 Tax=Fusarium torreyae TaxID=1237075 RepID=A0A9W8VJN3_9HYPO|nr:hypothetical protein NW762_001169 [Fusarium torreyae]
MPPPKTDEEIQASWGPLQWEFLKWHDENDEAIRATLRQGADWFAYDKMIEQKWPDPRDRDAFDEWCDEWFGRHTTRMSYQMSSREFLDMVSQTNFLDDEKTGVLYWTIEMHNVPFVTLCESNFGGVLTCYCFKPLARYIEQNREDSEHRQVIDNGLLMMDLDPDVSIVPNRHSANSSEDSSPHLRPPSVFMDYDPESASPKSPESHTMSPDSQMTSRQPSILSVNSIGSRRVSNSSTHAPPAGVDTLRQRYKSRERPRITTETLQSPEAKSPNQFVFAQLGALFVFGGDWEQARQSGRDAINEGPWLQNGYCIVVRINEEGEPGAVYAVYNHAEEEDCAQVSDDFHDPELICDHVPGFLHPKCNRFALVLKIADSLDDLGSHDKRLDFTSGGPSEIGWQVHKGQAKRLFSLSTLDIFNEALFPTCSLLDSSRSTAKGQQKLIIFFSYYQALMRSRKVALHVEETPNFEVLPLYSRLPPPEQDKTFNEPVRCRRAAAGNISKANVIGGPALELPVGFHPRVGMKTLVNAPASKASFRSGAGRAGHTQPASSTGYKRRKA